MLSKIKETKLGTLLYNIGLVLILLFVYVIILMNRYPSDLQEFDTYRHFANLSRIEVTTLSAEWDAATYYHQANELLIESEFATLCESMGCPPEVPWKTEDYPDLASWFDDHAEILSLIERGSSLDDCRRPIGEIENPYYYPPIEVFPTEFMNYITTNLGYSLGKDDPEQSLHDIFLSLRVLDHLRQSRSMTKSIAAFAYEKKMHGLIQNVFVEGQVSPQFCRKLIEFVHPFEKYSHETAWRDMVLELGMQHVAIKDYYQGMFEQDSTFFGRIGDVLGWRLKTALTSGGKELRDYHEYFDLLLEQWDEPYYSTRYKEIGQKVIELQAERRTKYFPFQDKVPDLLASRYATKLISGLTLYQFEKGQYPDSLQMLVPNYLASIPEDPYTGGQWKYHTMDESLVLSVVQDGEEKNILSISGKN